MVAQQGRKKSLIFKYGRMQKKIPSRLVCGSHGTCLDCMLPGVQVTTGLEFCSAFKSFNSSDLVYSEDSDSLLYRLWPSCRSLVGQCNREREREKCQYALPLTTITQLQNMYHLDVGLWQKGIKRFHWLVLKTSDKLQQCLVPHQLDTFCCHS